MNLDEYQELAARTIPTDKEQKMRIAEFSVGICEEAGESAGVIKKVIFHDHPMTDEKENKLIEELGDVLWHVQAIATELGISLEYIADYNIKKLRKRYPIGFNNVDSLKRVDVKQ